jgi:peroxiredoxin
MLPLGTALPSFRLPDVTSDRSVDSSSFSGDVAVVAFICNHCPFVKHIRGGLAELGRFCAERGAQMVAISSNDATAHPADGPGPMKREAEEQGYGFPYLFDEAQDVALAFDAACTPEFYVFDRDGKLAYRGELDDSRPGNGKPVTGAAVRAAVDALLVGVAPPADQRPGVGCNIKWKPGRAPVRG